MKVRYAAFVFFAIFVLSVGDAGSQGGKKFAELDGTWTLIKMEIEGKSLLEKGEVLKLVIRDGKITADGKGAPKGPVDVAKFLDPSKKPKTITYAYEGKIVFYGIYEVKGDELRVCGDGVDTATEKNPEGRRPKKLESNEGLLFVFKREKK